MYIYAYLAFLLAIPVAEGSAEEDFGAKFVGCTPVTIDGGAANLPPTSKGGLDSGSMMNNIYFYLINLHLHSNYIFFLIQDLSIDNEIKIKVVK